MTKDRDAPIPVFTIIPAQAGFCIAIFIPSGQDEKPLFDYVPIIAWKIEHERFDSAAQRGQHERYHHVSPITADGMVPEGLTNDWMIKYPDGNFDGFCSRYSNEENALAAMQRDHERSLAEKAKAVSSSTSS